MKLLLRREHEGMAASVRPAPLEFNCIHCGTGGAEFPLFAASGRNSLTYLSPLWQTFLRAVASGGPLRDSSQEAAFSVITKNIELGRIMAIGGKAPGKELAAVSREYRNFQGRDQRCDALSTMHVLACSAASAGFPNGAEGSYIHLPTIS